jgi:hypothetical protein
VYEGRGCFGDWLADGCDQGDAPADEDVVECLYAGVTGRDEIGLRREML